MLLMRLWETSSPTRSFRLLQVLGRDPEGWGDRRKESTQVRRWGIGWGRTRQVRGARSGVGCPG